MPAAAQVSAEVALQSDYRLRGYSLSDGQPVAALSLGYDDPSGFYVGGTAIGTIRDGDPELFALQAAAGYAARIAPGVSIDAGVARSHYLSAYGSSRNLYYSEVYVGLATSHLTGRLRFSPDYFRDDNPVLYAELETGFEVAPDWLVNGHFGMLSYLDEVPPTLTRRRYDWRLGGTRRLGPYGLHLELTGRFSKRPPGYYGLAGSDSDGTAVVASVTRAL